MITCTINEIQDYNLILLNDIPNILKIEDDVDVDSAQKAYLYFTVSGATSLPVTGDGQYTITVEGETISNVTDFSNAINKNFYISRGANGDKATAASIARAFRNCSTLAANWVVQQIGSTVRLVARNPFETDTQSYSTDIISPSWNNKLILSGGDATNVSQLTGAKVIVDIYKGSNDEYVTTLEKTCSLNEVAFNISPVLTTFAEYGKAVPFSYNISYLTSGGSYYQLNDPDEDRNFISIGYLCNQSQKYLSNNMFAIAQNVSRGNSWLGVSNRNGNIINHTLLYIYEPYIPFSFYRGNIGGATVTIDYLDSAFNVIGTLVTTWRSTDSSKVLVDTGYTLNNGQEYNDYWNRAFYIDFCFGQDVLRFNVIKPLYATEANQRIYWRNEYNGISFVDLAGKQSQQKTIETQSYNKNIYDFYTDGINGLELVYNIDVNAIYTVKSHIFEGDGRWLYNSLLQSSNVWTEINGQTYRILIDSISVEELDNGNDLWESTVKYRLSQPTTLA